MSQIFDPEFRSSFYRTLRSLLIKPDCSDLRETAIALWYTQLEPEAQAALKGSEGHFSLHQLDGIGPWYLTLVIDYGDKMPAIALPENTEHLHQCCEEILARMGILVVVVNGCDNYKLVLQYEPDNKVWNGCAAIAP